MRIHLVLLVAACTQRGNRAVPSKEQLGEALFNDPALSEPAGQACSDCHDPAAAFADPEDERTSAGAIRDRFGSRNAQSVMYAGFIPPLEPRGEHMVGGLFWDGRVSSLEAQAAVPLLNPLEMNNPDQATVVRKVAGKHTRAMKAVFGPHALDDVATAFSHITEAIAAFERTTMFSPFTSRYDRYLAGTGGLTDRELVGLRIFEDPARGNCASCHPSRPSAEGAAPLFTTFGYANLSIPPFADNPFYRLPAPLNPEGELFIDRGLGKTLDDPAYDGMFRIPSLRNVARTTPYAHNGYFRRLDEMIRFIDERDPTIQLSRQDVADLIAFLSTLTDASVEAAN